jgi:hypothetical protein
MGLGDGSAPNRFSVLGGTGSVFKRIPRALPAGATLSRPERTGTLCFLPYKETGQSAR